MRSINNSQDNSSFETDSKLRVKSIRVNIAKKNIEMELSQNEGSKKNSFYSTLQPKQISENKRTLSIRGSEKNNAYNLNDSRVYGSKCSLGQITKTFNDLNNSKSFRNPTHMSNHSVTSNKHSRSSNRNEIYSRSRNFQQVKKRKEKKKNSISKKEVIEILKLHKKLQNKISTLEKKFEKC